MAYELNEPRVTIVIDDGPYAGAEIETRMVMSPAVYFGTKQLLAQIDAQAGDDGQTDLVMEASRDLAALFWEHGLIGWNLRYPAGPHRGEPIPVTLEAINALDSRFVGKVVTTWLGHIGRTPLPLPVSSRNGRANPGQRPSARRRSTTGGSSSAGTRSRRSTAPTSTGSSGSAD